MWAAVGLNRREEANDLKIEIIEATVHPDYRRRHNDLVLFRLSSAVTFGPFLRPACLHNVPSLRPNIELVATGWGRLENGRPHLILLFHSGVQRTLSMFSKLHS